MTKSTKIIAALGVAAGLGIAALPAGAIFAEASISPWPMAYDGHTTEDVTVKLTIDEAIAIGVDKAECEGTGSAANGHFTLKDTGECAMHVAGGTNGTKGVIVTEKTKDNATDYLKLAGSTTKTAQNSIDAVNAAPNTTDGGWTINGGLLINHATSSTPAELMVTRGAKQVEIPVTYSFATRGDQEAGVYSTQITYTVASNNAAVAEGGINNASAVYPPSN